MTVRSTGYKFPVDLTERLEGKHMKDGTERYPVLGSGEYATVHAMRSYPGHVVKIATKDAAYNDFARHAVEHPSRLFPEVRRHWVDVEHQFTVTVSERLEATCIRQPDGYHSYNYIWQGTLGIQYAALLRLLGWLHEDPWEERRLMYRIERIGCPVPAGVKECKDILGEDRYSSFMRLAEVKDERWIWDLHEENVMARGDELVITDPWADLESRRLVA